MPPARALVIATNAAVRAQVTLYRICSFGLRALGALRPSPRGRSRGSLLASHLRHKVFLVAPGCGGLRRRGPRPPRRLQPPCPCRGGISPGLLRQAYGAQGRAQQWRRDGSGARGRGAFLAVSLAAIGHNARQPLRPLRASPIRRRCSGLRRAPCAAPGPPHGKLTVRPRPRRREGAHAARIARRLARRAFRRLQKHARRFFFSR